tara:strand:- start:121 stop:396 length:276 start_codon:yes stop_codon:yes gene_type:complete
MAKFNIKDWQNKQLNEFYYESEIGRSSRNEIRKLHTAIQGTFSEVGRKIDRQSRWMEKNKSKVNKAVKQCKELQKFFEEMKQAGRDKKFDS